MKLAAYLGRLPSVQVSAVAKRAGPEAEGALARAGVEGLATHLAGAERVAALFDCLDPEVRRVAYRLAMLPGSEAPVALLVHFLGQGSGAGRARVEEAVRALCDADLAFWVRPDAVAMPEEFLPGVVRVLERRAVRVVAADGVPRERVWERPPTRVVADLARLLGRLRLGAATTRTGRVARREQLRLAAYVEGGGEGIAAATGRDFDLAPAWDEYDARLAPWLAVAALYGLVRVERGRGVVPSPEGERFLAQDAWWQWERAAEAWLHLMRRHGAGLRALSPDFIASSPEGGWLDLEAAAEEYGRASDPWGLTPRALLRLISATGYLLGTLRLASRGEAAAGETPLPLVMPTAAMRALAERKAAPLVPVEGRLHLDANMEVVAMGDLPARLWADLALWAQPRTLDRASVWQFTPASVGAAAAAGWAVTGLLAALAEAAAGGVPQAMEVRLREWGHAAAVEVRLRSVVRLEEGSDRARLKELLLRLGLERAGEGLFLADPARHAEVVRALEAERVRVRADEISPSPFSPPSGGRGGRRLQMPWPGPFQERLSLTFPGAGRARRR